MKRGVILLGPVLLMIALLFSCHKKGSDKNIPSDRAYLQPASPSLGESQNNEISSAQTAFSPAFEHRYTDADFADHINDIKHTVPPGFTIVVQEPFVIIGDEAPEVVQDRAEQTIKWFVGQMRKMYFKKDPAVIYDIWLFRDDKSYRKYSRELFGAEPDTPFGFFSAAGEALVMNIGTGGGTLCHEIVHSFMPTNFFDCPAWFNEGLASLYEQCEERQGQIAGLTNWRLKGLQQKIQARTLVSFKTLMSTSSGQFYGDGRGDNYAQARYLCYYLQEKQLLAPFYRAFVSNHKDDPTGYQTLKNILDIQTEEEMDAFQGRWEKWVLDLRFL